MKISLSDNFKKESKRLYKKYHSLVNEVIALMKDLQTNPIQGTSLVRDCYKIRLGIASKNTGKSGSGRVITCVKIIKEEVILLSIYDKAKQSDISDKTLTELLKDNNLL